jgi:hypothetical protein
VSRGRLVVHGHFHQPSRVDPFSWAIPADPSAAPAHDWTARVSAECYAPNAQRWRLAMFASDAWFWDDPVRPETGAVLLAAAWAARRIDGLAGSRLERRLVADLAILRSPGHHVDGAEIYLRALTEVGQPAP